MKQVKGANYRLVVRKSPIEGDGVFAGEEIPWGRKIIEYRGAVISDKEAQARIAAGANAIMELGRDQNIDGFDNGNGAALVNHSRKQPELLPAAREGQGVAGRRRRGHQSRRGADLRLRLGLLPAQGQARGVRVGRGRRRAGTRASLPHAPARAGAHPDASDGVST